MTSTAVRLAAVGDLHCTKTSQGAFQPMFARIPEAADMLLLAGDITDYGLPEEARIVARELAALRLPIVAVLGNHDYESGKEDEVRQILVDAGVVVLDGDACEINGVGIAGVKGFGGGFGQRALGPWGETIIKQFVHAAVDEALKLEAALARLRTEHLVALLHYAPVQQTAEGEPQGGWTPEEILTIERALDAYTAAVAEQAFAERVWGRLVPGASADLIWLNRDPRDTPALELPALRIRGTYVRGTLGHPVTP